MAYMAPETNEIFQKFVELQDGHYKPKVSELVVMIASLSGLNINFLNITTGLFAAKDPIYAMMCLYPIAAFFVMML